jgi:hypothetical protein
MSTRWIIQPKLVNFDVEEWNDVETSVFTGRCEVVAGFDNAGVYSTLTSDTVDPSKVQRTLDK